MNEDQARLIVTLICGVIDYFKAPGIEEEEKAKDAMIFALKEIKDTDTP